MDDWIFQGGFPEILVEGESGRYDITQHRFRYTGAGNGAWQVPLVFSSAGDRDVHLLGTASTTLDVAGPLVVNDGEKQQVIVNGQNFARGYDLDTGKELWRCGGQTQRPCASAVSADGLVFVGSGFRGSRASATCLGWCSCRG